VTDTSRSSCRLPGATRDAQSVTADWMPAQAPAIHDVRFIEPRWVNKFNGRLVELFRRDWFDDRVEIDQVFHVVLNAHRVSAWHAHEHTTDRLFVAAGHVHIVLYDSRVESPSRGRLMQLLVSEHRPQLVIVPPGIWHGVENVNSEPAVIVNMPDRAYEYEQPDHWRLPPDTIEIPYAFRGAAAAGTAI
jgi:dTDP-4-dehydrorhamnose 3,5-epimerase